MHEIHIINFKVVAWSITIPLLHIFNILSRPRIVVHALPQRPLVKYFFSYGQPNQDLQIPKQKYIYKLCNARDEG